ncbi:hypothetical protein [Pseudomonas sp. Marseille-P9899]|uniref:hypothetical protein n=1 Tax=Pseudomonas sp. Marseille-P9899 TaxID=2730401 RepID=UPI00158ADD9E|nr:hypothetical protein [Pseudomonas sp. Marseille-P9899]
MSDLIKMQVIVKNYNLQASGDLDSLYSQVRLEDAEGNTFYFKQVVIPNYLKGHGAFVTDVPRVWYFKKLSKKAIVILAFETNSGKVEYDLDVVKFIARSTVIKGIVMSIATVPMAVIVATATFGLGLALIPVGMWYGYRNIFKVPSMISRKRLLSDFAAHGIVVR